MSQSLLMTEPIGLLVNANSAFDAATYVLQEQLKQSKVCNQAVASLPSICQTVFKKAFQSQTCSDIYPQAQKAVPESVLSALRFSHWHKLWLGGPTQNTETRKHTPSSITYLCNAFSDCLQKMAKKSLDLACSRFKQPQFNSLGSGQESSTDSSFLDFCSIHYFVDPKKNKCTAICDTAKEACDIVATNIHGIAVKASMKDGICTPTNQTYVSSSHAIELERSFLASGGLQTRTWNPWTVFAAIGISALALGVGLWWSSRPADSKQEDANQEQPPEQRPSTPLKKSQEIELIVHTAPAQTVTPSSLDPLKQPGRVNTTLVTEDVSEDDLPMQQIVTKYTNGTTAAAALVLGGIYWAWRTITPILTSKLLAATSFGSICSESFVNNGTHCTLSQNLTPVAPQGANDLQTGSYTAATLTAAALAAGLALRNMPGLWSHSPKDLPSPLSSLKVNHLNSKKEGKEIGTGVLTGSGTVAKAQNTSKAAPPIPSPQKHPLSAPIKTNEKWVEKAVEKYDFPCQYAAAQRLKKGGIWNAIAAATFFMGGVFYSAWKTIASTFTFRFREAASHAGATLLSLPPFCFIPQLSSAFFVRYLGFLTNHTKAEVWNNID